MVFFYLEVNICDLFYYFIAILIDFIILVFIFLLLLRTNNNYKLKQLFINLFCNIFNYKIYCMFI